MTTHPWLDSRIPLVRPAAIEAYLKGKGWTRLPDAPDNFHVFEPASGDDAPTVQVPQRDQGRDYPQRITELLTDLARFENRPAQAILDEILAQAPATANGVHSLPSPQPGSAVS